MARYASKSQARFFHSEGAKKAGITAAEVKTRDQATKGRFKGLPEHVKKRRK